MPDPNFHTPKCYHFQARQLKLDEEVGSPSPVNVLAELYD